MKEIINKTFIDGYLTCGATYDNFIFDKCSLEVMKFAISNLSKTQSETFKSVNLCFSSADKAMMDKIASCCDNDYQKNLLAGSYFNLKYMLGILNVFGEKRSEFKKQDLIDIIKTFSSGRLDLAIDCYRRSPSNYDINVITKKVPKFELNIFCLGEQNKYLQMAINNYISSRLPYSIKLFTNSDRLSTYFTSSGEFMQSPHDYLSIDNRMVG